MAETTAVGTESASPHEQETTKTTSPRRMKVCQSAPKKSGGTTATSTPRTNIAGV